MKISLNIKNVLKLAVALLASFYFFYYTKHTSGWHLLDSVDLTMHEAGHNIFFFFGDFLYVLGGSLFQFLFPCVFVSYFYLREEYFSASLLLFWVGQNLVNVSVYASDAVAMQLPLLGGDNSIHDWNNILGRLGLLNHTHQIGSAIYAAGFLVILCAACLSVFFAIFQKEN